MANVHLRQIIEIVHIHSWNRVILILLYLRNKLLTCWLLGPTPGSCGNHHHLLRIGLDMYSYMHAHSFPKYPPIHHAKHYLTYCFPDLGGTLGGWSTPSKILPLASLEASTVEVVVATGAFYTHVWAIQTKINKRNSKSYSKIINTNI